MENSTEYSYPSDLDHQPEVEEGFHRNGESLRATAVRGLGTGAIAAPMAVSFREEKLALQSFDAAIAGVHPREALPSIERRHDRT